MNSVSEPRATVARVGADHPEAPRRSAPPAVVCEARGSHLAGREREAVVFAAIRRAVSPSWTEANPTSPTWSSGCWPTSYSILAKCIREPLMAGVRGYDHIGDGRTADVHVARLRRRLGAAHRHQVVTVRRLGYKYVPDQQERPTGASRASVASCR
ncbi:hypothetical protein FHS41_005182 [Streptomyces violarus]|uniref:OmpR/PhoB-type domain-containing protein n=1 Tax=Streptomyces violarus TaxID=67380 RepID=A0A7W4ZUC8_9ACTN|nr:hypothetical protein [Streptomyces violarus]